MRYSRDEYRNESDNQRKISILKRWTPVIAFITFVTTWNPFIVFLIFIISKAARKSLEDSIAIKKSGMKKSKFRDINNYLEDTFLDTDSIEIGENVTLKSEGRFTDADDCCLYYADEKIGKLRELKKYYPSSYQEVYDLLYQMSLYDKKQPIYRESKVESSPSFEKKENKVVEENKTQEFIDIINGLNDDNFDDSRQIPGNRRKDS